MKLMIDIPTDLYNKLMKHKEFYTTTTIFSAITNGTPVSTDGDLISRSDLKKTLCEEYDAREHYIGEIMLKAIDNAPTVEVPEDEVNCVLTMFGKCSYNKTGCSDCEIKDKIRKALNERPQGEWIPVSERLPEKEGWYLVFLENERMAVAHSDGIIANHDFEPKMLAWQPLPEPYQKGSKV